MQAATFTHLPNDAGALMCGICIGMHHYYCQVGVRECCQVCTKVHICSRRSTL